MSKLLAIAFVLVTSLLQTACTEPTTVDLTVFATELTVHSAAGAEQSVIGTLHYGDKVLLDEGDAKAIAAGPTDHWVKINTEQLEGYVLGTYLLPLPAADLTKGGFQSLLSGLSTTGDPETSVTDDLDIISQQYGDGVLHHEYRFKMPGGDFFSEERLFVANLSVFQGALLARAFSAQEGHTSYRMTVLPELQTDENGVPSFYDDNEWQIITVNQAPGGILIQFPERAD